MTLRQCCSLLLIAFSFHVNAGYNFEYLQVAGFTFNNVGIAIPPNAVIVKMPNGSFMISSDGANYASIIDDKGFIKIIVEISGIDSEYFITDVNGWGMMTNNPVAPSCPQQPPANCAPQPQAIMNDTLHSTMPLVPAAQHTLFPTRLSYPTYAPPIPTGSQILPERPVRVLPPQAQTPTFHPSVSMPPPLVLPQQPVVTNAPVATPQRNSDEQEEKNKKLMRESQELIKRLEELQSQVVDVEKEKQVLSESNKTAEQENITLETLEKKLADVERENEALRTSLNKTKSNYHNLKEQLIESRNSEKNLNVNIENLEDKVKELTQQTKSLSSDFASKEKESKINYDSSLESLKKVKAINYDLKRRLESQVVQHKSEKHSLLEKLQRKEKELDDARLKSCTLSEYIETIEEEKTTEKMSHQNEKENMESQIEQLYSELQARDDQLTILRKKPSTKSSSTQTDASEYNQNHEELAVNDQPATILFPPKKEEAHKKKYRRKSVKVRSQSNERLSDLVRRIEDGSVNASDMAVEYENPINKPVNYDQLKLKALRKNILHITKTLSIATEDFSYEDANQLITNMNDLKDDIKRSDDFKNALKIFIKAVSDKVNALLSSDKRVIKKGSRKKQIKEPLLIESFLRQLSKLHIRLWTLLYSIEPELAMEFSLINITPAQLLFNNHRDAFFDRYYQFLIEAPEWIILKENMKDDLKNLAMISQFDEKSLIRLFETLLYSAVSSDSGLLLAVISIVQSNEDNIDLLFDSIFSGNSLVSPEKRKHLFNLFFCNFKVSAKVYNFNTSRENIQKFTFSDNRNSYNKMYFLQDKLEKILARSLVVWKKELKALDHNLDGRVKQVSVVVEREREMLLQKIKDFSVSIYENAGEYKNQSLKSAVLYQLAKSSMVMVGIDESSIVVDPYGVLERLGLKMLPGVNSDLFSATLSLINDENTNLSFQEMVKALMEYCVTNDDELSDAYHSVLDVEIENPRDDKEFSEKLFYKISDEPYFKFNPQQGWGGSPLIKAMSSLVKRSIIILITANAELLDNINLAVIIKPDGYFEELNIETLKQYLEAEDDTLLIGFIKDYSDTGIGFWFPLQRVLNTIEDRPPSLNSDDDSLLQIGLGAEQIDDLSILDLIANETQKSLHDALLDQFYLIHTSVRQEAERNLDPVGRLNTLGLETLIPASGNTIFHSLARLGSADSAAGEGQYLINILLSILATPTPEMGEELHQWSEGIRFVYTSESLTNYVSGITRDNNLNPSEPMGWGGEALFVHIARKMDHPILLILANYEFDDRDNIALHFATDGSIERYTLEQLRGMSWPSDVRIISFLQGAVQSHWFALRQIQQEDGMPVDETEKEEILPLPPEAEHIQDIDSILHPSPTNMATEEARIRQNILNYQAPYTGLIQESAL